MRIGSPSCRLAIALVFACALTACHRSSEENHHVRGARLNKECRQAIGDDFVYRTGAGFDLAVPKWASGSLQPSQYGADCSLQTIRLVFAWVDGKLIPLQQGGEYAPPPGPALPERYDTLVVAMSFRPPHTMASPEDWDGCKDRQSRVDYPAYKLRMCPQYQRANAPQPPLFGLPYRPRFELVGETFPRYSLSCADEDFAHATLENVVEATTTQYSCRGSWYWRPGAAGMFDLGSGAVLKKFHLVLPAAERLLDGWVVGTPSPRSDPAFRGSARNGA